MVGPSETPLKSGEAGLRLAEPVRFPGYDVLFDLAEGGMGVVSLALRRSPTGATRLVALKRLHRHLESDREARAAFAREGEIGMALFHANLVPVLDVVARGEHLALVMDYVEGTSLSHAMQLVRTRAAVVPVGIALAIAADALSGLAALHGARSQAGVPLHIVHRDVSPQNILVGLDGTSRIVDYGIATTAFRGEVTDPGVLRGKLSYFAPERLRGDSADARGDLFAAAIVLHELLSGARLFLGETPAETIGLLLEGRVPRLSGLRDDVPAALDDVLAKALDQKPDLRFSSAVEMLSALEAIGRLARPGEVASWIGGLLGGAVDEQRARVQGALHARDTEATQEIPPPSVPERLPESSTPFVGRARPLAELGKLVRRGGFIVVTGPPGIGKTRLVEEVLRRGVTRPVRWIELASAPDRDAARERVLRAAFAGGARPPTTAPARRLFARAGPMTLVLDGADHLGREALEEWATWTSPERVTIVVTTRFGGGLGLGDVVTLPPLPLPRPTEPLASSDAGALLVALAAERGIGGATLERQAVVLGEALAAAGGNPLAIEGIAGRVVAACRDGEPSEKVLRAIVDDIARGGGDLSIASALSWGLFTDAERRLLSHVAMFEGPFSRADAARITPVFDDATFDGLVQKFAVSAAPGREERFLVPPGLRRIVFERSPIVAEARRAHAENILATEGAALRVADYLFAAETWLASSNDDRRRRAAELFVAGRMSMERGFADPARVARVGARILAMSGESEHDDEAHLMMASACAMLGELEEADRHRDIATKGAQLRGDRTLEARALLASAWDRFRRSDFMGVRDDVSRAEALLPDGEDEDLRFLAKRYRAAAARELGETAVARDLNSAAIAHAAAASDITLASSAIGQLAVCFLDEARWSDAVQAATEAVTMARSAKARRDLMYGCLVQGMGFHFMGLRAEQERAHAEAMSLEAYALPRVVAYVHGYAGIMALEHGDADDARARLERAMAVERAAGHSHFFGYWAAAAGALACASGNVHIGRALLDRAEVVLERGPKWASATLAAYRALAEHWASPGSDASKELARRRLAVARTTVVGLDLHLALRVVRALEPELLERPTATATTLHVDLVRSRFRVGDGATIDLSRRAPLARIVAALTDARIRGAPGVSPTELIEAGWPGERAPVRVAKNRLHVTLSMLRRLGFRDVLAGDGTTYSLARDVELSLVTSGAREGSGPLQTPAAKRSSKAPPR